MNTQLLREKIDYTKQAQNFSYALRLAEKLFELEPSDQLAQEIKTLREFIDLKIEKDHKAKIAFLTRKASTVNLVNSVSMRAHEIITAFVRENGIEKKADGKFTKKYETKLKAALSSISDLEKLTWFFEHPTYIDGFYFEVKTSYQAENNGWRYYYVREYFSVSNCAESVKPAERATDRTAEFYIQAEKELKEKTALLRELESQVNILKAIENE